MVRVSGPTAHLAARTLAGELPPARTARLRTLHDPEHGGVLDRALVLRFDAPRSSTGENLAELHLHGGRAVVSAVEAALLRQPGVRRAEPGEFTRRAFANGRIDLAEADGLADLLAAETEQQRRLAMQAVSGHVSRRIDQWRMRLLDISARVEAAIDFDDEADVGDPGALPFDEIAALVAEWEQELAQPSVERLRDAVVVVLAGPVNAGKSTLFNALVRRDAAIVSPIAGTTRDLVEAEVVHGGSAYRLVDSAGWRDHSDDSIEREGIARSRQAIAGADIVLWLGDEPGDVLTEAKVIAVHSRCDLTGRARPPEGSIAVSGTTGHGLANLWRAVEMAAPALLDGRIAFNERQLGVLQKARGELAAVTGDLVLLAQQLQHALYRFDVLSGRAGIEDMLDVLFGRFCLGK